MLRVIIFAGIIKNILSNSNSTIRTIYLFQNISAVKFGSHSKADYLSNLKIIY